MTLSAPAVRLPRTAGGRLALAVFIAGATIRVAFVALYRPALLGIADSGTYVNAAHGNLLLDPVHPAGYALFLAAVHALDPHLTATIVLQHALGVATAGIYFEVVRRETGSPLAGLLPAVLLLFNGLNLLTEHTPLSEPLFEFLVACALLTASRARTVPIAGLTGLLLAAATVVRSVGLILTLAVIVAVAIGRAGDPGRRRLIAAATCTIVAVALTGLYIGVQRAHSGVTGLTASDGRIAYSIVAPFADCTQFTPPSGTRGLCQNRSQRHGSSNQYLFGYPDHGPMPAGGRAAVSPAWRRFGPMPGGNAQLAAFARAAIVAQPADYLNGAWANFTCAWRCGDGRFVTSALALDPDVERAVTAYYATGSGRSIHAEGVLRAYADSVEINNPLYLILLVLSLTALSAATVRRRVAWLHLAGGWLLLAGSAAVSADPRYTLPSLGPLAVAAAIGLRRPVLLRWIRRAGSPRP